MRDLVVERAEVFVVGPPTERYAWSESMSEQFMANTVLRLTTRGGLNRDQFETDSFGCRLG